MTSTLTPAASMAEPQPMRSRAWLLWAVLGSRLVLAGMLGYAALTKIGDPAVTVRAVRAYRLLPDSIEVPFAHALPSVELAIAVLLLVGIAVRLTGVLSSVLMGMFLVGIISAAARGLRIDCGCFGGGGVTEDPQYALELTRDGALFLLATFIAIVGRSRYALDPPPVPDAPVEVDPDAPRAAQRKQRIAVARAEAAHMQRRRRIRWYEGGAGGLVALAAIVGIIAGSASAPAATLPTPPGVTSRGGIVVGSAQAPHRLILFEDPQCPVCADFEVGTGTLLARAVAIGKVSVEYRMRSFLGPESVRAVAALGAAHEEDRFEVLREALFTHQPPEQTGGYTIDDLLALGRSVGLTSRAFEQAVRGQTYATWARRIDDQASRDGNVGTPELRYDGQPVPTETLFSPTKFAALLGLP